jgi:hypothetical protein
MVAIKGDSMSKEGSQISPRNFSVTNGGFKIFAAVYELDTDCLVILYGGTRPHIGAVGMGQVRQSLKDIEQIGATSSVFAYVGHKEDVVAKTLSEELTRRLGRNTVVVAGMHWDGLSEEGIKNIRNACQVLTDRIVRKLSPSHRNA